MCIIWIQEPPVGFSSQEKTVSLKKEPRHSLGITIAGGRDCRSRLPSTSLVCSRWLPAQRRHRQKQVISSCLHIKCSALSIMCNACVNCDVMAAAGDVLLSINDIDLTHLTYNEAVTILKTQAAQTTVTLRVIQTFAEEEEQDGESSTREDMEEHWRDPKRMTLIGLLSGPAGWVCPGTIFLC